MAEVTRGDWARYLLNRLSIPYSMPAIDSLVIWQTVEGGGGADGAKWNPLNTTWQMPDAARFNDDGVESYAALNDGLNATAMTLERGETEWGYAAILEALKVGDTVAFGYAVLNSAWGTESMPAEATDEMRNAVISPPA